MHGSWGFSKRLKKDLTLYVNILQSCPPVALNNWVRASKSNQLLSVTQCTYTCKFGEMPSIGSRDIMGI